MAGGLSLPLHFELSNGAFVVRRAYYALVISRSGLNLRIRDKEPIALARDGAAIHYMHVASDIAGVVRRQE